MYCHIFNVLTVRGLLNEEATPSTPYHFFFGKRPLISQFRVFGCLSIAHHWVLHNQTNGKQTERGTWGIFVGYHMNQKGYMIFSPISHQIVISDDVIFDKKIPVPLLLHGSNTKIAWHYNHSIAMFQISQQQLNTLVLLRILHRLQPKRGMVTVMLILIKKKMKKMIHHLYVMQLTMTLMNMMMTMHPLHLNHHWWQWKSYGGRL